MSCNAPSPISQLEVTRSLVRKFTMANDESLLLPNPAAQHYFSVVEALAETLALPCPTLTESKDQAPPDLHRFEGTSADAAKSFAALFSFEQATASEPAAKRARVSAPESLGDWLELLQGDTIGKLTMPALKAYLKEHDQPLSGKKDELVARVQTHLRQRVAKESGEAWGVAKMEDNGADE